MTDGEYWSALGLGPDDRIRHEFEDGVDGGPPRKVGTWIIRASGEIVPWPLVPPPACDRSPSC